MKLQTTDSLGLRVVVADASGAVRTAVGGPLEEAGCDVVTVGHGRDVVELVTRRDIDAVVCDVDLPRAAGRDLQQWLSQQHPEIDCILMATQVSLPDAVAAVKGGATDYLVKPVDTDLLLHTLERVSRRRQLEAEVEVARHAVVNDLLGPAIVGNSPAMRRLLDRLGKMAVSNAAILIRGESGTGKELVARMIHERSPRADKPFIALNCAAFPETLLEAELFGHERGAFTGAQKRRIGRFQAAHGGTLFLDEIAEVPLAAQAKLLRVVQEGMIEPLGSNDSIRVDVRILSATHRDLKQRIGDGQFREDLFFRLKVLEVQIPPLRQRSGDIPLLVEHFLRRFSMSDPVPTLTRRAWEALTSYPFPGNVRELEHAVQHAVVLADDSIDIGHLPSEISGANDEELEGDNAMSDDAPGFAPLAEAVREFERHHLIQALHLSDGSRTRAASLLGISRKNLWEKLRAHGLAEFLK